ncbi:hypothetical protein B0J14DRAFT_669536 [Halenospora varia]|nr:hypothetical protein B0J14DRAFT_669536 [Halenospora varia]
MEAVARLHQRYLWVDDKAVQVPAMKTIYGGALVTIVAAAGDGVDAGLPRVNTDRMEPLVVDVRGYRVIEATTPLSPFHGSPVIGTTWNTRAWTFQELLLSPRSLIFLDQQVYWRCAQGEFFEELDFDDPKMHDIYNDFSGVLKAIPDEFFWGTPHSQFGEYLVWDKAWLIDCKTGPLQLRNLPRIPTWSWIAWKGQLSMRYDGHHPSSLISCYRFRNGQLERMSMPKITSFSLGNVEMDYDLPIEAMWENEDEHLVTIEDIPTNIALEDNHVIFWTFAFTFEVQNFWRARRRLNLNWYLTIWLLSERMDGETCTY